METGQKFGMIPTPALFDAHTGLTTMHPALKNRTPGLKLIGPAVTVQCLVGSNRRLGKVNVSISYGGVPVNPGDWIVGGDDRVVVVPQENPEQVIKAGLAIEDNKRDIATNIDNGTRIADILEMRSQWE